MMKIRFFGMNADTSNSYTPRVRYKADKAERPALITELSGWTEPEPAYAESRMHFLRLPKE